MLQKLSSLNPGSFESLTTVVQWTDNGPTYYGMPFGDTERNPELMSKLKEKSFEEGIPVVEEYDFTQQVPGYPALPCVFPVMPSKTNPHALAWTKH
jgi:hypothetical protein